MKKLKITKRATKFSLRLYCFSVGVLKELDPFGEQKRNAFLSSINAVEQLVCHLVQVLSEVEGKDLDQMKIPFIQFMKVILLHDVYKN